MNTTRSVLRRDLLILKKKTLEFKFVYGRTPAGVRFWRISGFQRGFQWKNENFQVGRRTSSFQRGFQWKNEDFRAGPDNGSGPNPGNPTILLGSIMEIPGV